MATDLDMDGSAAGAAAGSMAAEELQVKFVTKAAQYEVPDTTFAVPARFTRLGLSQVINHLLELSPAIPFDFLIDGVFLRSSLAKYVAKHGLSGETTITIEYVPAMQPPETQSDLKEPDWIADLTATASHFASGSYDGGIRVYNAAGETVVAVSGHTRPVTSVRFGKRGDDIILGSTGADGAAKTWKLVAGTGVLQQVASLSGHTASVESICFSPDGTKAVTGGWDLQLHIWDLPAGAAGAAGDADDESRAVSSKKKLRGATGAVPAATELTPALSLTGFAQAITCVAWPTPNTLIGGSNDHSIRLWDLSAPSGTAAVDLHGNKAINDLSVAADGVTIATAHPDHIVRLWDPRAATANVVRLTLKSHTAWVTSVAWLPGSEYGLMSTSHDGAVKLWDIRSSTPLHSIAAHPDAKALCGTWMVNEAGVMVLSGGSDSKIKRSIAKLGPGLLAPASAE